MIWRFAALLGVMKNRLKLFQLITMLERKHSFATLDADCRQILDFIGRRQIENLPNDAGTIIASLEISRPTVYRKLSNLKDRQFIREIWLEQRLNYELDARAIVFLGELSTELRAFFSARE